MPPISSLSPPLKKSHHKSKRAHFLLQLLHAKIYPWLYQGKIQQAHHGGYSPQQHEYKIVLHHIHQNQVVLPSHRELCCTCKGQQSLFYPKYTWHGLRYTLWNGKISIILQTMGPQAVRQQELGQCQDFIPRGTNRSQPSNKPWNGIWQHLQWINLHQPNIQQINGIIQ